MQTLRQINVALIYNYISYASPTLMRVKPDARHGSIRSVLLTEKVLRFIPIDIKEKNSSEYIPARILQASIY